MELPRVRFTPPNPLVRRVQPTPVLIDTTPLRGPLRQLQPIEFELVRRSRDEPLFNSLIEQHHYLGYEQPVGEHLKYLVWARGAELQAGAAITTLLPNLYQDNFLTGGVPFVVNPYLTAVPGVPVPFLDTLTQFNLPPVYTPDGQLVFKTGRSTDVAANTQIDVLRFEQELAALTPGQHPNPLNIRC